MFHVRWLQAALDELAAVWLTATTDERRAITSASHIIDERLSENPHEQGESRPNGRRIMFVAPLAARFEIKGQVVTVLHVRVFRRRSR
jgi:hypothetical protein